MSARNLILFNEQRSNPLIDTVAAMGYEMVQNVWQPTPQQLARVAFAWVNFYDCAKYPLRILRFRRRMNRAGVPVLAWNRDAPSYKGRPVWRIKLLSYFRPLDIYMSHSLADGLLFGSQQLLMPNATDIERYNLAGHSLQALADPSFYRHDVSFFGGLYTPGHLGLVKRRDFLNELAHRLDSLGIRHYFGEGKELDLSGQIDLIQRSRINLQYGATCEYPEHEAGGLPERCFGVPACGGFQLCDRRYHSQDSFTVGRDYVEFDSMDDCVAKIRYYLDHLGEARHIAELAYDRVRREHTYKHRAQTLLDVVDTWRRYNRAANP